MIFRKIQKMGKILKWSISFQIRHSQRLENVIGGAIEVLMEIPAKIVRTDIMVLYQSW